MPEPIIYHSTPPGLLPLFARALLPKQHKPGDNTRIPELQVELVGMATNTPALPRYLKVCGFQQSSRLPATWPHVLAFPLHLKLLTDESFPLPLLGLVHLRNTITQHRPVSTGENLDIRVVLGHQQRTDRGIEFDLITEARSAGTLIWEEVSTNLFRSNTQQSTEPKSAPPKLKKWPLTELITAPENIGRQYAKVAGDRNPIHMHALSARAFGFPRAIAHGMWSKARVLALLEKRDAWKDGAFTISCQFKKPLLLPGTAQLNWQENDKGWDYQLLNEKGTAPHLGGRIDWL
ncbi:MaoC family dehydratase [Marinobacter sp.]|uniref:MaoC family dehydratase n=1 Tax=Marinobacter sp. TaxID=50741 RepID=UPI003566D5F7